MINSIKVVIITYNLLKFINTKIYAVSIMAYIVVLKITHL
jgi:hypothetical protein